MNQTDPTAALHLTRDQLAALLAHHADVLAANLRTDGTTGLPENAAGIKRAAELRDLHAEHLTAEKECAPVTELLDSILAFPAYRAAWLTNEPLPAAASAVVAPPTDRAAVLLEVADRLKRKADKLAEGLDDLAIFVGKARAAEAEILNREAEELRRLAAEAQQQPDTETRLAKVERWVTSEVVTAKTEFGDGYRAALRDIRDVIRGRYDYDPRAATGAAPVVQQPDTEPEPVHLDEDGRDVETGHFPGCASQSYPDPGICYCDAPAVPEQPAACGDPQHRHTGPCHVYASPARGAVKQQPAAADTEETCDGCGHPKHPARECPVTQYGERCACDEPITPEEPRP